MLKRATKCLSKKILIYVSLCMFWTADGITSIRKSNNYRLPRAIVPEHYTLTINTYLENDFKFDGDVLIKLKILESTNTVILHSVDLDIAFDKVKLIDNTLREIGIERQYFDRSNDFYIIELQDYLQKWNLNYSLYIPFNGTLTEALAGYYRSSYIDRTSYKKKWLAITQFESTDARRAFPCFDEPGMKATFRISMGHERKYTAISNMPLESTIQRGYKWVVDYFAPTVKMSTYLVAFAVTEFDYRYVDNATNTIFRVWARKDAMKQVDYAATVGPKYLKFFENYFNISFPLPKQDMIAIPDFNSGAMENWGLITYRETALLYDPNISSAAAQHRVTSTIAHELAHQWFGNLVTMKWWTDLWLNEGFATFMAAKAVHYLNPEWNSIADENVDNTLEIYKLDRLESSHPISVPIGHPSEITHIFDIITYRKGSFIIRMMSLFLGEKVFRQGVSNYLRKYAYENADKNDLWAALTDEAHKRGVLESDVDVKTVMDTWTVQTGYPLVTVTRNKNNRGLFIKQERFGSKSRDKSCWWIPLSYTTAKISNFNDTTPKAWLKCSLGEKSYTSIKFAKDLPDNSQWVIFNIQLAGLYKVNYDTKNWELLIRALINDHNSIPVLNRVQLIDDSMDLASAGHLDYHYAFKLLRYLKHETEYLPWSVAFHHLNYLNVMLRRTHVDGIFAKYVRQLVSPIYEKVAYQLEKNSTQGIKRLVLISAWACRFGVGDCEEQANHLYATWMKMKNSDNINPIPKDLRGLVYCTAIRNGGEKEWDFLWQKYLKSNVGSEKQTLLQCLGCSKEVWILKRYLDMSLKSVFDIRKQDMLYVFESVSKNIVGFYLAKEFFKTNIEELHKYFGTKSDRLSRFMKLLARQMYTTLELEEFEEFCNKYKAILKDSTVGVQQSLEKIRNNINWHTKHFNEINLLFRRMDSDLYDIIY